MDTTVFAITAIVVALVLAVKAVLHRLRDSLFLRFAEPFGGRLLQRASFAHDPSVEIDLRGRTGVVREVCVKDGPHQVEVQCFLGKGQACGFWMRLYTILANDRRTGHFDGIRTRVGYRDFDGDFAIVTTNEARLKEFLIDDVRDCIRDLLDLELTPAGATQHPRPNLNITVSASCVVIMRDEVRVESADELRAFYEASMVFVDCLLEYLAFTAVPPGEVVPTKLQYLPPSRGIAEGDVVCQVCGDAIHSDRVTCMLCETPHHRQCWDYMERCSTYGCPSRKAR